MNSLASRQRVWVVEDSPLEGREVCQALGPDFDCELFVDWPAAIERLVAGDTPDVLLLDWELPGMSGVEVCRFIRTTYDELRLPILLVTARRESADVVEGLASGANDFVAKPYIPEVLLARTKALARMRELHRERVDADAQLFTTLRAIGDAVISTDAAGDVRFMNLAAERLTGWTAETALGRPLTEIYHVVHEDGRARVESPVDKVLREGVTVGLVSHCLLVCLDGRELPVDHSAAPIRDEKKQLAGVVLMFRDISDRKRADAEREALLARTSAAQAEAEAERYKLHAVFTQSPVAIAMVEGPEHTYSFANPAYQGIVGNKDVVGKPMLEALPELRGQGFESLLNEVVASGEPFLGSEVPVKLAHHKDDEWLYVNLSYRPRRDAEGNIDGVLITAFDVTEQVLSRQHVERARKSALLLARERQTAYDVLEHGGPIYILDASWRFTFVNEAWLQWTGNRREDVMGYVIWDVFAATSGPNGEYFEAYDKVMAERVPVHFSGHYASKDLWFSISLYPTLEGGVASFVRDIGQEKRAELEAQQRASFERQLIGIVSHDLRTPLNTITLGTNLLLRREGMDEKSLKSLLRVQSAAERGARMVKDLLDFTQARVGGGIPVVFSPCNLHTVVREVVEELATTTPDREVRVSIEGDGHGTWDVERMYQVVLNLVGNALKYSPADSLVDVLCQDEAAGLSVAIHNGGEPIEADSLARIFQPLQRATSQLGNSARSVGLGLFIVKHLVEAHHGTLTVSSTREAGTTFRFWVPRRAEV